MNIKSGIDKKPSEANSEDLVGNRGKFCSYKLSSVVSINKI